MHRLRKLALLVLAGLQPLPLLAASSWDQAFQKLEGADKALADVSGKPAIDQANVLGQLGIVCIQALDGERADGFLRQATEKLGPVSDSTRGGHQQLLKLRIEALRLQGDWTGVAEQARKLQLLIEGLKDGKTSEAGLQSLLIRWEALDLAGRQAEADQVAALVRERNPEGQWTRLLDLESRRKAPVLPVSYDYSQYFYVDPTGRPVSEAYRQASAFEGERAVVQRGEAYGALDTRLRQRIPFRFSRLRTIPDFPQRLLARRPIGLGVEVFGIVDGDGKPVVPLAFENLAGMEYGVVTGIRDPGDVAERKNRADRRKQLGIAKADEGLTREYFRVSDGKPVTKAEYDAAALEWQYTKSSYAPYRYDGKAYAEGRPVLWDRQGNKVFPPQPLPEELKPFTGIQRVDGDLVVLRGLVELAISPKARRGGAQRVSVFSQSDAVRRLGSEEEEARLRPGPRHHRPGTLREVRGGDRGPETGRQVWPAPEGRNLGGRAQVE